MMIFRKHLDMAIIQKRRSRWSKKFRHQIAKRDDVRRRTRGIVKHSEWPLER